MVLVMMRWYVLVTRSIIIITILIIIISYFVGFLMIMTLSLIELHTLKNSMIFSHILLGDW